MITPKQLARDREALMDGIGAALADVAGPLEKRIAELETRLAEVQERGVKYCGVFQGASTYNRGDLVTSGGSMWHSNVDGNRSKPGTGTSWQLAVKAGRDAK